MQEVEVVVSRRDDVRPRSSERYVTTGYDCGLNVVMKVRQRIKSIYRDGGVQIYTGLTCLCLMKDYQVVKTANDNDI